ncbi:SAF domain-containing protein [Amycolatopsis sp. NPDC059657]|uniref:SAF domain-containing protein n=1 Tax=Amycolatopsis sp. NPDC059657 TaxID=3346899 RepID=UPI00366ED315
MSTTNDTQTDNDRTADTPWLSSKRKPATFSRLRGVGRRRSIPHLALGGLLVVACAAGFVLISVSAGDRRPVLALVRAVPVGHVVTAQDLRQASVAVDPDVATLDASQANTVVGKTMATSLAAGSLLTRDSLGAPVIPVAGQAIASLSLKSGQVPPEVSAGTRVTVVFVPNPAGAAVASPPAPDSSAPSWPATVVSVTSPPNEQVTVVSVQLAEAVARQVAAVPAGQVSLVMLAGGGR